MRERRDSEVERRTQSNIQSQRRAQHKAAQSKQKKKKSKAPMIICLILAIAIGWFIEFDIKSFIENISKYEVAIVKKDDEPQPTNDDSNPNEYDSEEAKESNIEQVASNEVINSEIPEVQQPKQEQQQETKQDKISKANQAIISNCGPEWSEVIYAGESPHPTKGGNYYIFNLGPDGMGDMQFYVDVNTYKVYEYSVDGYFGEYRDGNYDIFTYDMAIRRLENELGWDEKRTYTLEDEDSEGYTIRTSFLIEPGSGEGLFYVTSDFLDIAFE